MAIVERVIAWTAALAITGGVLWGIWLVAREPMRMWKRRQRGSAVLTGFAVCCGLLFLWGASQIVP